MLTTASHRRPIVGRLHYDSRRNLILLGQAPLRHDEVDVLTEDERSALNAFKAHLVLRKSGLGDDRWLMAV